MLIPKIYVVCMASYRAGKLHGTWIDAKQPPEKLREAIDTMLKTSPRPGATEWSIIDSEGFDPVDATDGYSLEFLSELAYAIDRSKSSKR